MNLRSPLALLLAATLVTVGTTRAAESVSIGAAANLVFALDSLNAEFKKSAPDVNLTSATGASGNLVVQIKNGAPYDVFLSADLDYPQALIKAGNAEAKSLVTFATGRLVLWTTRPGLEVRDIAATVRSPAVQKLAIANLDTAPYGRAAKQALEKLGAWTVALPKIVTGENITQTAQFVETGNADAGFVALSLVLSPKLKDKGRWLEVPADLHAPLDHGAVLTSRGAENGAAKRYLEFLQSEAAKKILREYGYGVK
jgi:molybdate transport system substrate-binding protein